MPPQPLPARPIFNAAGLPISSSQYVGWIDTMGIQSAMGRSMDIAANSIFKLHIAVLESLDALPEHQRDNISLYPVMDGVYFVTNDQPALFRFLRRLFGCLAREFIETAEMRHRFLVRGALACGPVVHGFQLPEGASSVLHDHGKYRDSILVGLPMIQAYLTERLAPLSPSTCMSRQGPSPRNRVGRSGRHGGGGLRHRQTIDGPIWRSASRRLARLLRMVRGAGGRDRV